MYVVHDVKHDAILTVKAAEGSALAFHRQVMRAADKWRALGVDPTTDVHVVHVTPEAKEVAARLKEAGDHKGEAVALYAAGLTMGSLIRDAQHRRDGTVDDVRHELWRLGRRNAREKAIRFVWSKR